ncbi:MAG: hypothetical protein ACK5XN_22620, partial [Bacteroidota bacterium]
MFFVYCSSKIIKNKIHFNSIDLGDFLEILLADEEKEIFLKIRKPIQIKEVFYNNLSKMEILEDVCKKNNLRLEISETSIVIMEEYGYWDLHTLKFFYEDDLSDLMSFFDNERNSSDKKTEKKQSKSSIFWNEIENNIREISNKKYSIDKYNGFINIYGDKNVHKKVENYLKKISKQLYKQVQI